jgi:hypothetical protein
MLKRGTQIAYVPLHAKNNIGHPDVQFGFVTSVRGDTVFCRYWSKSHHGLRTTANSEGAYKNMIVEYTSRPQEDVIRTLEWMDEQEGA